jgi:flagellar motor switch protein FliN/FliY
MAEMEDPSSKEPIEPESEAKETVESAEAAGAAGEPADDAGAAAAAAAAAEAAEEAAMEAEMAAMAEAVKASEAAKAEAAAAAEAAEAAEAAASASAGVQTDSGIGLLYDVELDATLQFGSKEMLLRDVLDLGPGDVVELDRHIAEPVDLVVGDRIVARGEVVVANGNFALRILEVATPQMRLESIRCLF